MDEQILERRWSRRAFGRGALAAGAAAAGASLLGGTLGERTGVFATTVEAAALTDVDILNFALNLEYLEAEFYTIITTGKRLADIGIATTGTGTAGPTTGGRKLPFSPAMKEIFDEIAFDEQQHVRFLRQALGTAAVAKPAINLAGVSNAKFNPDSVNPAIALARAFEDVGVSAYGGAARYIANKDYLEAATRIALTEGEHSGNIRLIVAQENIPTFALWSNDYPPPPTGTRYFNVSDQALAKIRSASMVLAILYNNQSPGANRGGFFPQGLNGTIRTA